MRYIRYALCMCFAAVLTACGGGSVSTDGGDYESAAPAGSYTYGRFAVEVTSTGQRIHGGQFMPPVAMPVASSARHAILVNYTTKELLYYRDGQATLGFAVVTPDKGYLPRSVVRGRVNAIERNPGWCPTPNILRDMPYLAEELIGGCLPYGHEKNPMGMAKFHINWEVGGWSAVRLHGSSGYPEGNFWNAETYGCTNLLDSAMAQLLSTIGNSGVREGIEIIVYR